MDSQVRRHGGRLMLFEVNLIRVWEKPLTDAQYKELNDNCRHIDGSWWIFEGDVEFLETPAIVVAVGVTRGLHPDDVPRGRPIIDHAVDIFNIPSWPPPSWWRPA